MAKRRPQDAPGSPAELGAAVSPSSSAEAGPGATQAAQSLVASGAHIQLPVRPPRAPPISVGVQGVRRPERASGDNRRRMGASSAGAESDLFAAGGPAFERWAIDEKGLRHGERRTAGEWDALLREFASRPIHGHRRKVTA